MTVSHSLDPKILLDTCQVVSAARETKMQTNSFLKLVCCFS